MTNLTSQQDEFIFFIDTVSLNFVEIGQYLFHDERHCGSFTLLCSGMSCRHSFKRWRVTTIKRMDPLETPKLGPYWKLQHVISMVQKELRTELSLWAETILIRGLEFLMDQIEFVMDLNNNDTEILEDLLEAHALQLDAKIFVSRSKAKEQSTKRRTFENRIWIDVEPVKYLFSDHEVSKKWICLLRHGNLLTEDEGLVQFWRIEEIHQKYFTCCRHWSDSKWNESMGGEGGN